MATVKLKKYKDICVQIELRNGEDAWVRNMRDSDVEGVHELECLILKIHGHFPTLNMKCREVQFHGHWWLKQIMR